MVKLIHSAITSHDGYVNDASGSFDWSAPDEEVHAFVNDLELLDERRFPNGVVHPQYRVKNEESV